MKSGLFMHALFALTTLSVSPMAYAEEEITWTPTEVNGTAYYGLNLLRTFYKLSSAEPKKGSTQQVIRNSAFSLALTPDSREATISGYRVQLSAPAVKDAAGELMVSVTDFVKLIDPVLRPTYIAERRDVQTVVIDPGHGGTDSGNKTAFINEGEYTLKLAQELAEELKKRGINTVLTRNGNHDLSDTERVKIADSTRNAVFVSLHLNSGRSDVQGIETYTIAPATPHKRAMAGNRLDAANAALAFAIQSHTVAATKATDRACRRAHYTLLNTINCPAVMVMVGYATNEKEATALATDAYRAELVKGLANGIATFKTAIRPGATITVPTPPRVAEPAPEPKEISKPAEPEKKKPAADTKKKNTGSSNKNKRNTNRNNSSTRRRR